MKKGILFFLIFISISVYSQGNDEQQIRQTLKEQTTAWNNGDVEAFMTGYWKNDSLIFVGKNGVTSGWQTTLNNYKRGYPDTTAMGKLNFDILQVKKLSSEYYFVVGKWHLQRTIGDVGGHFTLLFKKINGQWLIVADHSS
jgi:ketosteroid isomerase-like protein